MAVQPIGQLLDSLGVTLALHDGDIVADAVVITKTIDADGNVSVGLGTSESCSWLEQLGLITAANCIAQKGFEMRDRT